MISRSLLVYFFGAICWICSAQAQCTQNLLPFTDICSGQGTCDNNTRCICHENYGGVGLHFDVGDTDCPTHLLAFRSLAYVQFGCGGIAVILIIWRIFTFRPWASPVKTKGQKRALTNLATFLVAAAINMIVVALYIFGDMYQYNSIVGLIFHCLFWVVVGADIYFRKLNVYQLFKAASWGNDRKRFAKRSKTIFGLEVLSAVLIPVTLLPMSIATYCIDDIQTRIALVQAGSASLILSFTLIGLVPLTYSLKLQKNLKEHLKSELDANKTTIKKGLKKLRGINIALMGTIVLPLIPNVLVIAMPITHVYIYHSFYILYLLTSIQGAAVLITPSKVAKGPKTSSGSTDTSDPTTLSAK
jgi:hypothetical protein